MKYEKQSMLCALHIVFQHHFQDFGTFWQPVFLVSYHNCKKQQIQEKGMVKKLNTCNHNIILHLPQYHSRQPPKDVQVQPAPTPSYLASDLTITLKNLVCLLNQQKTNLFLFFHVCGQFPCQLTTHSHDHETLCEGGAGICEGRKGKVGYIR